MKIMKEWAEIANLQFEKEYGWGGCTCFQSPPCGYCTHGGNPLNLEEDEDAWCLTIDEMVEKVMKELENDINLLVEKHLLEMRVKSDEYKEMYELRMAKIEN